MMPKGIRSELSDPIARKAAGYVVEENVPEKPLLSKKIIVGTGMNSETMLRLDQEGVVLIFEQTDKFLPLGEGTLTQLGRDNRLRYSMAKEFHDAWRGDEHAKLVEDFKVDRQFSGSATDKMKIDGNAGLHVRWAAPYNVEKYRALGYKVLSADEANSFLGPKSGHHEIGTLGQPDLIAMGIPEAMYKQMVAKTSEANAKKAGAWKTSGLNEVNQSGAQGFVATDDDRRRWAETDPSADE
jgi:hypothetical protein